MNSKAQILFLKRLSFLLSSGRSIHESLKLCISGEKPKFQEKILPLITSVQEGKLFSDSLKQHKFLKDSFSIQIICLGEQTGSLASAVDLASLELENKRVLFNKLVSSLLYPICVVGGTFIIALALVFFIFPKVVPIFLGLGVKLPLSTRIMLWTVSTVIDHWILTGIAELFFIFCAGYILKKHNWRIPLVKRLWLSRVFRIIGLTTQSGMPINQSVAFCAETLSEPHYKKALKLVATEVGEGKKLGLVLGHHHQLFPPMAASFIEIAEQGGSLSEALLYLSSFYQSEVEMMTKRLTELIEPALMIILGLCIGFVGVSLITPIYGITNHVYH